MAIAAGQARQFKVGTVLPGRIPGRFVKGVKGLAITTLDFEGQPQVVQRFPIVGIGIAPGQAGDGGTEIGFGFGKFAPPVEQQAQRVVTAAIVGIAAQGFYIISFRAKGGVAILFQV